ncbi:MAG: flagellin [Gammaproteobacteria bacterium]|nr:flagellin [Gammaproteobacteria bacterium]
MPQFINTNVASLNTQRALNGSQNALQTSLQRLSSGLRINSAKDDAAGLAISERFTGQIRGLNQAVRNANDGISLAQTAEGALASVGGSLQRIRELAVQSANDTNSAGDRQAINDEVQQLISEIERVANTTEFNGQRVLDGSLTDLFFQVGANQGQTIAVTGVDSRTSVLGTSESAATATGLSQTQINDPAQGITGFTAEMTITVDGAAAAFATTELVASTTMEGAVRAINNAIDTAANGDAVIADANLKASLRVDNAGLTSIVVTGKYDLNTANPLFVTTAVSANVADPAGGADIPTVIHAGGNSTQEALTTIDVTTRLDSFEAIAAVDGALNQVNSLRGELGAVQVRFSSTIANLQTTSENLSASRSRIRDADFAQETAELTRNQIIQQAGIAMLSQANSAPQNVLSLLQ